MIFGRNLLAASMKQKFGLEHIPYGVSSSKPELFQPVLIASARRTPNASPDSLECQTPSMFQDLLNISCLHKQSYLTTDLHEHLPSKVLYNLIILLFQTTLA